MGFLKSFFTKDKRTFRSGFKPFKNFFQLGTAIAGNSVDDKKLMSWKKYFWNVMLVLLPH